MKGRVKMGGCGLRECNLNEDLSCVASAARQALELQAAKLAMLYESGGSVARPALSSAATNRSRCAALEPAAVRGEGAPHARSAAESRVAPSAA